MRWAQGLFLAATAVLLTGQPSVGESNTAQAEAYIRKACETVWSGAAAYQVERCTARAMASLDDTNRLRDNELKRLLLDSERELDRCQQELRGEREEALRHESATTTQPDPESSSES